MTQHSKDTSPLGRSVEEVEETSAQPSQEQGGFLSGLIHPSPASEQQQMVEAPSLGQVFTHTLGMDDGEARDKDADNDTTDSSQA